MAEQFQNPRIGFQNYIYWDDLVNETSSAKESSRGGRDERESDCTVMQGRGQHGKTGSIRDARIKETQL